MSVLIEVSDACLFAENMKHNNLGMMLYCHENLITAINPEYEEKINNYDIQDIEFVLTLAHKNGITVVVEFEKKIYVLSSNVTEIEDEYENTEFETNFKLLLKAEDVSLAVEHAFNHWKALQKRDAMKAV